jgi:diguanylate cyclase (GGDEF)-like protein
MQKPFAMIIEDDRDTVALFRHVLDFAGYKTEIALRGEKAIERLGVATPDIILLDLNLPGISGSEVLTYIQSQERLEDTRVVVVTGHSEMALGLSRETDLILLKPVSADQLTNLILRLRPVDPNQPETHPRDSLTQLYSRPFFISRLGYSVERARQLSGSVFGVIFVDIDNFQEISRDKGESFANEVLKAAADFFRSSIRTIDTISRFNVDHFFIQIEDLNTKDTLTRIAERIHRGFPSYIEEKTGISPQVSIGLVYCDAEYLWPEDIITDADIALHFSKRSADDPITVFNPIVHGSYRLPPNYQSIQRVGLSPKDPTKPRDMD